MSKLMLHLVANYPSPKEFLEVLQVFLNLQIPHLEIQPPYYSPLGDGKLIFEANQKALEFQSDLVEIVKSIESIYDPKIHSTNLILMSYFSPIFSFGMERVVSLISESFRAMIIPDLNCDSPYFAEINKLCQLNSIDIIPVISQNLSQNKLDLILKYLNKGQLVYYISRFGKTGQTTDLQNIQPELFKIQNYFKDFQLAVGFGINNKSQVDFLNQNNLVAVIGTETIRQINFAKNNNLNLTNHITNYINQLTQHNYD